MRVTVIDDDMPALPDASAPALAITAVGTVAEDATQQFRATATGGTYDTIAYAWEVVSGGGVITNGGLYDPPDVDAETAGRVRITGTVAGTGVQAASGTSDTATDTEDFTITPVAAAVTRDVLSSACGRLTAPSKQADLTGAENERGSGNPNRCQCVARRQRGGLCLAFAVPRSRLATSLWFI